jgi:hypothetical protein
MKEAMGVKRVQLKCIGAEVMFTSAWPHTWVLSAHPCSTNVTTYQRRNTGRVCRHLPWTRLLNEAPTVSMHAE